MKKRRVNCGFIVVAALFLSGAALFMYPYVTRLQSDILSKNAIDEFKKQIATVSSKDINNAPHAGIVLPTEINASVPSETLQSEDTDKSNSYYGLYKAAYQYNDDIFKDRQAGIKDQDSYQESLFNLSDYGLKSDAFGYISIPEIDVELPIYLGASKKNMALGAVHLTYTSLPLDQDNTNCVIAAHRGYRGAEFFRHIDELEPGDTITIHTPWNILTYTVFETKIIQNNDFGQVLIREGKKILTLSSCHPYTQNTHRYLVFAELTDCDTYDE